MIRIILLLFFALSILSCKEEIINPSDKPLFRYVDTKTSSVSFENKLKELKDRNIGFYDYFYNGAGVGVADFNNDGLEDIFFAGNDASNKLYINKGDLQFADVTESSGLLSRKWSTGVSIVDINKDGLMDIYVCNGGPYLDSTMIANDLFINQGDQTFKESSAEYGLNIPSRSIQASFFDMDNDGDLDLWVINHGLRNRGKSPAEWFNKFNEITKSKADMEVNNLFRNEGNNRFTNISHEAGIQKPGFSLGLVINDFNDDGYLDVYVANDYFIPDFLFINNQNESFTDKAKSNFSHLSYYSMGADMADINNDGLDDLITVDMTPDDHIRNKTLMASMNTFLFEFLSKTLDFTPQYMFNSLYINNGSGIMSDIGHYAGVSQSDWSWAPLLADFNNDGYKDLYITNGFYRDTKDNDWKNQLSEIRESKGDDYAPEDYYKQLLKARSVPVDNRLYLNRNGYSFSDVTTAAGLSNPSFSNGAAYADFDNDGDLDLVTNNISTPAFLIENINKENNYLKVGLSENGIENTILHSTICIYLGTAMQCADYKRVRGYMSSVSPIVHFGLGKNNHVDSLIVYWNDNTVSKLLDISGNQLIEIDKAKVERISIIKSKTKRLFNEVSKHLLDAPFVHRENDYNEYEKEVLLPHTQARLGPALAVADINGDGLEDFFVGGGPGQMGVIYMQESNGKFTKKTNVGLETDRPFEDIGAVFFDSDGDSDMDLYVASGGGADVENNISILQDRLYINDGKGNLSKEPDRLPEIRSSTKAIIPLDWDSDGDLDLFIGGRTLPGRYPLTPKSYFLENRNGTYVDVSEIMDNLDPGMITDGIATDINNDGREDLLLVGEWMPITILYNESGLFSKEHIDTISNSSGWWQSVMNCDLDQDGLDEYVLGNIGLNNKFHPSPDKPLHIYASDFDSSGTLDIVLSKKYKNVYVPTRGKECSTEQMPFISEKFETYEEFAQASIIDIFGEEKLNSSTHYKAVNFASSVLKIEKGGFSLEQLPPEAQFAPINGIVANDFDGDGYQELIIAGNLFDTEVETTSYDAGKGLYLKNNKGIGFSINLDINKTGIFMTKNVKDIQLIRLSNKSIPAIIVANNNSDIQIFLYDINN